MVNVQAIGHANGIAKYILKYVSKFDDCNRVKGSANADTGALKVGSQFLHNTKISTSRINEEKTFKNQRDKHLPHGRDMPLLEMYQLMLGLSEVTTNLTFIQVPTLSFEVRVQHKITLHKKVKSILSVTLIIITMTMTMIILVELQLNVSEKMKILTYIFGRS